MSRRNCQDCRDLRSALEEIRGFARERKDLSWDDHGDEFRKVFELANEALGDGPTSEGRVYRLDYGTPGITSVSTDVMHSEPTETKRAMTAALEASVPYIGEGEGR